MWKRGGPSETSPSGGKTFAKLKKKFSSAEKIKKNPFKTHSRHGITDDALSSRLSSDSFQPLRLTVFHNSSTDESPDVSSFNAQQNAGRGSTFPGKQLDFQPTSQAMVDYTTASASFIPSSETHHGQQTNMVLNSSHQPTFMPSR